MFRIVPTTNAYGSMTLGKIEGRRRELGRSVSRTPAGRASKFTPAKIHGAESVAYA